MLALVLALAGCGPSTTAETGPQPSREGRFVPQTHMEGDQAVLHLEFPDGTEAELVYPAELDIAALGIRPNSSGHLRAESPTAMRGDVIGRDFWIFHGNLRDVLQEVNEGERPRLLAEYGGVGGTTVGPLGPGPDR